MKELTCLETIIEVIKNLHGDDTIKYEDLTIDTVDVLENLRNLEVTSYETWNELEDNDIEYIDNKINSDKAIENYLYYLKETEGLEEGISDNTYNWNSPISNHINFVNYKCNNGYTYVKLMVHMYGDVRANYTNYCLLECLDDIEFLEALNEYSKYYTLKDKEDKEIYFYLGIMREGLVYLDSDEYSYNGLDLFYYENIDDLQRDILALED